MFGTWGLGFGGFWDGWAAALSEANDFALAGCGLPLKLKL